MEAGFIAFKLQAVKPFQFEIIKIYFSYNLPIIHPSPTSL